jgi:membrane protein YdbS with pleckstrin-like domain
MSAAYYLDKAGTHAIRAAAFLMLAIACVAWIAAAVAHASALGAACALMGAAIFTILTIHAARDAARYFSISEQRSRVDRLIRQHPAGTGSEP